MHFNNTISFFATDRRELILWIGAANAPFFPPGGYLSLADFSHSCEIPPKSLRWRFARPVKVTSLFVTPLFSDFVVLAVTDVIPSFHMPIRFFAETPVRIVTSRFPNVCF